MRLSGRNLRAGMAGEDVAQLHAELMRLGFAVAETEARGGIFGVGTAQAVAPVQKSQGLWNTAVADRHTADALTRAIADFNQDTMLVPRVEPRRTPAGPGPAVPEVAGPVPAGPQA